MHQFTSLPFELRRAIYLLATQPRFVHVEEVRFRHAFKVQDAYSGEGEDDDDDNDDEDDDDDDDDEDDEDDDYTASQEFLGFLNSTLPCNIHLHPSLAHFAPLWRFHVRTLGPQFGLDRALGQIPGPGMHQTLLTAFGFTSTAPRLQPWKPTPQTPEIDRHWLADNFQCRLGYAAEVVHAQPRADPAAAAHVRREP